MEILAVIVGLVLLVKSGILGSLGIGPPNGSVGGSYAQSSGGSLTPQQTQAQLGQVGQLGAEIGAGISFGTTIATSLSKKSSDDGSGDSSSSSGFATAIPIIGQALTAVASILLGQHTARLKGAIAENQLIPSTVNAFDADLRQVADAYNSGKATAAQCVSALQQIDQSIYNYMKSNATGPGRAWRETSAPYTPLCNAGCTTECCIYYNNLKRAIYDPGTSNGGTFGGGVTGMIPAIQAGRGTVYVPKVYPPPAQYGTFSREAYQIAIG